MERSRGEVSPRAVLVPVWQKTLVRDSRFARVPDQFATPSWIPETLTMVVGTSRGDVWALDLSGRTLWRARLRTPIESAPFILDQKIIVGSISGKLFALDRQTGRVLWEFQGFGSFMGHPVEIEGVLYVLTSQNMLYAIAVDSGEMHWSRRHETPKKYTVRGHSSPARFRNHLVFGLSSGRLMSVDMNRRGEVLWTLELEDGEEENYLDSDSTPVVHGETLFASSYRKGVVSVQAETGEINWRYGVEGVTRLIVYRERIYFVGARSGVHCLSLDGRLIWKQSLDQGTVSSLQVVNHRLLISFDDGGILALNPDNGFFYQRFDPGSGISGGFAATGSWLGTLANNGRLYLFEIR